MDIGKESQMKCLWLGAGVFVLPVMSLCTLGLWDLACSFFFLLAAALLLVLFVTQETISTILWGPQSRKQGREMSYKEKFSYNWVLPENWI